MNSHLLVPECANVLKQMKYEITLEFGVSERAIKFKKYGERVMMSKVTIRYLLVGVLNTIVGYLIYFLAIYFLALPYYTALVIAHIVGVIHSFLWNSKWTFRAGRIGTSHLTKFITVYLTTFMINLVFLYFLVQVFDNLVAQAIALITTTILSFIGHKYWSFKKVEMES